MTREWLSRTNAGYRIAVQVSPNAKKTEIVSSDGDVLRIKLQAQPVDGKANEALIQFIAKKLRTPKRNVTITHGLSAKRKLLEIGMFDTPEEEFEKQLLAS